MSLAAGARVPRPEGLLLSRPLTPPPRPELKGCALWLDVMPIPAIREVLACSVPEKP